MMIQQKKSMASSQDCVRNKAKKPKSIMQPKAYTEDTT